MFFFSLSNLPTRCPSRQLAKRRGGRGGVGLIFFPSCSSISSVQFGSVNGFAGCRFEAAVNWFGLALADDVSSSVSFCRATI